jgi:hypothetical protein
LSVLGGAVRPLATHRVGATGQLTSTFGLQHRWRLTKSFQSQADQLDRFGSGSRHAGEVPFDGAPVQSRPLGQRGRPDRPRRVDDGGDV